MDFYRFSNIPYNQSDELAKQIFAQQALASPSAVSYNEPHVMPAPTGSPWNMEGLPWGMNSPPHLVHFTAQSSQCEPKISPVIHCKRKSLDLEPVIPAKQLITEEKMAAHLNGLHISSDYTTHTLAPEDPMDVGMDSMTASSISEKVRGHKIVLAEEIKKMHQEPLLPAALIERLEKPQMSLVVWKPRDAILDKIKEIDEDKEKKEEPKLEETRQRNGVLVTEPCGMDVEI